MNSRSESLVSVVIPTRNRATLLMRALETVNTQTYPCLEVIVVDDASTDDTRNVLQACGFPSLRYTRLDRAHGGSYCRNVGIRAARSRYIAFLDDDDEWEAHKIEAQLPLLQRYDGVLSMYSMNGRRVKGRPGEAVPLGELRRGFVRGGSASALIVKAEIAKELLFDETLPRCQDWDFCIRLAQRYTLGCIDRPLVRYNDGRHLRISNAAVGLDLETIERRYRMLDKHREFLGERWYRWHMCRFLLYGMSGRPDAGQHIWRVGRRYGFGNVGRVLGAQVFALLRAGMDQSLGYARSRDAAHAS